MTAAAHDDFVQSFVATATAGGEPAVQWMRALTATYLRLRGLRVAPSSLLLFTGTGTGTGPDIETDPGLAPEALPAADELDRWAAFLADADVDILSHAHEALLDARHRHRRGVFYTPADVATALVALVLPDADADCEGDDPPTVLDPATGGGAFLLAAGRRLEQQGWSRAVIVDRALWGIDIDPLAVAVTDAVLRCWVASEKAGDGPARGVAPDPIESHIVVGDTLAVGRAAFAGRAAGTRPAPAAGFDAVVGNPPFQNQLGRGTARVPAASTAARAWLGTAAHRYADTSTVFLAAACRLVRPGGRVGLILPQSFLAADDAAAVRDDVLASADLEHLWVATEPIFAANVRVCAPVVRRHGSPAPRTTSPATRASTTEATPSLQRWWGRSFAPAPPIARPASPLTLGGTWAPLVADLFGVPAVALPAASVAPVDTTSTTGRSAAPAGASPGCLGDFCVATAGFRDQYYGLVPHVREASVGERAAVATGEPLRDVVPLLTCGLIGPVWSDWGRRTTKFAKRTWEAPVVDLAALADDDPALHRWALARRVPKLVLATQTRVVEAVVDDTGCWYPSVPSIALSCAPDRLWAAAAVVMAPAITSWAFQRHVGAALSADALKVSARQVLAAPLPTDADAWDRSAAHLESAHRCGRLGDPDGWRAELQRFADESAAAYRLPRADADAVTAWWLARLPTPGGPTAARVPAQPSEHDLQRAAGPGALATSGAPRRGR
jgi:hypothetical protein